MASAFFFKLVAKLSSDLLAMFGIVGWQRLGKFPASSYLDMWYLPVQAMMATKQSYATEEAASRVIPCVAPLAVDPVPEVRHSALATLEGFVKLLQEHSATRDSTAGAAEGASQQVCPCRCFAHQCRCTQVVPYSAAVHYNSFRGSPKTLTHMRKHQNLQMSSPLNSTKQSRNWTPLTPKPSLE